MKINWKQIKYIAEVLLFISFIGVCTASGIIEDASKKHAKEKTVYIKAFDKNHKDNDCIIHFRRYDINKRMINENGYCRFHQYVSTYKYNQITIDSLYKQKKF